MLVILGIYGFGSSATPDDLSNLRLRWKSLGIGTTSPNGTNLTLVVRVPYANEPQIRIETSDSAGNKRFRILSVNWFW